MSDKRKEGTLERVDDGNAWRHGEQAGKRWGGGGERVCGRCGDGERGLLGTADEKSKGTRAFVLRRTARCFADLALTSPPSPYVILLFTHSHKLPQTTSN